MGISAGISGKIISEILVLAANLFVAAAYYLDHIGYRGKVPAPPTIGNGVMDFGYILTVNPLTATVSRISTHVARVLRGTESIKQLPPHY